MNQFFKYASRHWDDMLMYVLQHIEMCGIALGIGLLIAVLISLLLIRFRAVKKPVVAVLGGLYAIPSMAFFSLLIPIFGLGMTDAIVALVVYCQFILVRNILAAFQNTDQSIIEAAYGMGMSRMQVFKDVQMPLAMPVIMSGIRIATISTISSATIAETVNAGGLGVLLFQGLRQLNNTKIIWGTILTAALTLVINEILMKIEKYCQKKARGELIKV